MDMENTTNHLPRELDSISQIHRVSDVCFAIVHVILSKISDLRALTVASRFVMPYLLFWVCGSAKTKIAGSLPAVLKDARTATVHFLASRIDVRLVLIHCTQIVFS